MLGLTIKHDNGVRIDLPDGDQIFIMVRKAQNTDASRLFIDADKKYDINRIKAIDIDMGIFFKKLKRSTLDSKQYLD